MVLFHNETSITYFLVLKFIIGVYMGHQTSVS